MKRAFEVEQKTFFLVSKVLSFRLKKQKNCFLNFWYFKYQKYIETNFEVVLSVLYMEDLLKNFVSLVFRQQTIFRLFSALLCCCWIFSS